MNKTNKITEGYIGSFELTTLLIITMSLKVLLTLPRVGIILSLSAGWMLGLGALLIAIVAFYFINKLYLRFPRLSIDEINNRVLGRWFGSLVNLSMVLFFVIYLIVNIREFAELIIASILPNTPISVIILILFLPILYGSYLGIENITRASFLIYPFLFAGFFLLYVLALPKANTLNLYPIFGGGLSKIIIGSFISVSRFAEGIITLGLLIPFIRNKKNVTKIGYFSIIIAGLTFTFSIIIYILIFDIPSGITTGVFPMYQLARIVSIGSFFQRLESIFILVWVFTAIFCMMVIFYSLNLIIARQLKLTVYRPLIFPIGILMYTLSFLPPDFPTTVTLEVNLIREFGSIPSVILPIFVLIVAKLRGLKDVI